VQPAGPEQAEKVAEGEFVNRSTGAGSRFENSGLLESQGRKIFLTGEVKYPAIGPVEARNLLYELSLSDDLKPVDMRFVFAAQKVPSSF
jgi:hypothetical protein